MIVQPYIRLQQLIFFIQIDYLLQKTPNDYHLLFTALLKRGAGDNLCYHPANCQQRVITLLSFAKCQEQDDNNLL